MINKLPLLEPVTLALIPQKLIAPKSLKMKERGFFKSPYDAIALR